MKRKKVKFREPQNETDMVIKRLEQDKRNNNNDIENKEMIDVQVTAVVYAVACEIESREVVCGVCIFEHHYC